MAHFNPIDSIENKVGAQASELQKTTLPQFFNQQKVTQQQQTSKYEQLFTFDKTVRTPEGAKEIFGGWA
jgi:hypothetical protein